MAIREFTGADFEPASKFLGTLLHAERGARSYWYGASDVCAALSASDAAFVVTDTSGAIAGIMCLAAPTETDVVHEMRTHWSGQRTVIRAVCSSLGFTLPPHVPSDPDAALAQALGERVSLVNLFAVAEALGDLETDALRDRGLAWLAERGVEVAAADNDDYDLVPNEGGDYSRIGAILDTHAATLGHTCHNIGYHFERDGVLVAGIIAWSYGADLYIDMLAVDESVRRQGLGSRLMAAVEDAGRRLGCTTASVDTFSFQAPDYYPAHGYREIFRRTLSDGTERIWFTKEL